MENKSDVIDLLQRALDRINSDGIERFGAEKWGSSCEQLTERGVLQDPSEHRFTRMLIEKGNAAAIVALLTNGDEVAERIQQIPEQDREQWLLDNADEIASLVGMEHFTQRGYESERRRRESDPRHMNEFQRYAAERAQRMGGK